MDFWDAFTPMGTTTVASIKVMEARLMSYESVELKDIPTVEQFGYVFMIVKNWFSVDRSPSNTF